MRLREAEHARTITSTTAANVGHCSLKKNLLNDYSIIKMDADEFSID